MGALERTRAEVAGPGLDFVTDEGRVGRLQLFARKTARVSGEGCTTRGLARGAPTESTIRGGASAGSRGSCVRKTWSMRAGAPARSCPVAGQGEAKPGAGQALIDRAKKRGDSDVTPTTQLNNHAITMIAMPIGSDQRHSEGRY